MSASKRRTGYRLWLLAFVVVLAIGAVPKTGHTQEATSAAVYSDVKDVIEDLIRAEVGRSVARQIRDGSSAATMNHYFGQALSRLETDFWGSIGPALLRGVTDLASDALYWRLSHPEGGLRLFIAAMNVRYARGVDGKVNPLGLVDEECSPPSSTDAKKRIYCDLVLGVRAEIAKRPKEVQYYLEDAITETFVHSAAAASVEQKDLYRHLFNTWIADRSTLRGFINRVMRSPTLRQLASTKQDITCQPDKESKPAELINFLLGTDPNTPLDVQRLACFAWVWPNNRPPSFSISLETAGGVLERAVPIDEVLDASIPRWNRVTGLSPNDTLSAALNDALMYECAPDQQCDLEKWYRAIKERGKSGAAGHKVLPVSVTLSGVDLGIGEVAIAPSADPKATAGPIILTSAKAAALVALLRRVESTQRDINDAIASVSVGEEARPLNVLRLINFATALSALVDRARGLGGDQPNQTDRAMLELALQGLEFGCAPPSSTLLTPSDVDASRADDPRRMPSRPAATAGKPGSKSDGGRAGTAPGGSSASGTADPSSVKPSPPAKPGADKPKTDTEQAFCGLVSSLRATLKEAEFLDLLRLVTREDMRGLAEKILSVALKDALETEDKRTVANARFFIAFAAYSMDVASRGADASESRAAFKSAAKTLLPGGAGFPQKGDFSRWFPTFITPSVSLRVAASSSFVNESSAERVRYVASAAWLTAFRYVPPFSRYFGVQMSLVDLLAPFSEFTFRKDASYDYEGRVWLADFLRPRIDLLVAVPDFSRSLAVSGSIGARFVRPIEVAAGSNRYRYENVFSDGFDAVTPEVSVGLNLFF